MTRVLAVLGTILAQTVSRVLVDPVRSGRPRPSRWPRGVAPIGAVALGAYVVAGIGVMAAPLVRRLDPMVPLGDGRFLGAWTVTVLFWLTTIVLALVVTALLHVHPLARWVGLLSVSLNLAVLGLGGSAAATLVTGVGVVGLWVLALARIGRSFAPTEFAIALVLASIAVFGPLALRPAIGLDSRGVSLLMLLSTLFVLAMPGLLMAGFAFAEVTVSGAEWLADRVAAHAGTTVVRVLTLALAAVALGRGVVGIIGGDWEWRLEAWAWSAGFLAVTAGAVALLLRAGRRADRVAPAATAMAATWARRAWWPALLLLLNVFPVQVGAIVSAVLTLSGVRGVDLAGALGSEQAVAVVRLTASLVAIGWAIVAAGRGQRGLAVVLAAFAAATTASSLSMATGGLIASRLTEETIGVLLAALVVVLALVRWRTARAWQAALGVTLLTVIYPFRQVLSDPVAVVGGVSAAAVLFLGLVWRVLSDGAIARGHSRAFPRASRVLLYFANALFGAVALAYAAQVRTHDANVDVEAFTALGDRLLGLPLFVGVGIVGLAAVVGAPAGRSGSRPAAVGDRVLTPAHPTAPNGSPQ